MKSKARVIAIYLPQYHPIPENDAVWGKGFTEWTNVVQAKPLFHGHYQPRIPRDLGFYDLRLPEVREMQAEYARNAGIEGFMYWQYYFGNGKMLLERPFEEVLKSRKPDFPFCLGWANHSWQTKSWTKNVSMKEGKTMIMEQRYDGVEQYIAHFYYNLPAFRDKRYITVDSKPLFVIWNPNDHEQEISSFIKTWRDLARKEGLSGIHFVGIEGETNTPEKLHRIGFDALLLAHHQLAINGSKRWKIKNRLHYWLKKKYGITLFIKKSDFGKNHPLLVTEEARRSDVYPSLTAGFDRSPRAGKGAELFYNFTPKTWRAHIRNVLSYISHKDYEHNIVFLKSWNEWGESNYVEPDLRYGTSMLDVLREEIMDKED